MISVFCPCFLVTLTGMAGPNYLVCHYWETFFNQLYLYQFIRILLFNSVVANSNAYGGQV